MCTHAEWPREMEFKIDETLEQPLELEMITPFGRCQGGTRRKVKRNGAIMAEVGWPDNLGGRHGVTAEFEQHSACIGRSAIWKCASDDKRNPGRGRRRAISKKAVGRQRQVSWRLTDTTQKENGAAQTEYKECGSYGSGTLSVGSI